MRIIEIRGVGHRDIRPVRIVTPPTRDASENLAFLLLARRRQFDEPSFEARIFQDQRDRALREVFDITCAMSAYPSVPEFVELQKQLGRAMDAEANLIAARDVRDLELQSA